MPKEKATRFTVSLPDSLMRTLDRLRSGRGYGTGASSCATSSGRSW